MHGLVSGAIGAVNPFITVIVKQSAGYTTGPDGTQIPAYATASFSAQIQALTEKDLQHIDGLNLQGTLRKIYFYGQVAAVVRATKSGGALVIVSSGANAGTWLTNQVVEQWPDWCSIIVTLQNGA